MYEIPKCPYCGKERPWHPYGGVGPCSCKGYQDAEKAEYRRLQEKAEAEEAERRARLRPKAISCDHHFVGGGGTYAGCYCTKCGISFGDYMRYK